MSSTLPSEWLAEMLGIPIYDENTAKASDDQASASETQPNPDESTVEALDGQASAGETQPNPIPIMWIALTAFAAVVLGTALAWLSRKKKSSRSYRLPKLHSIRIGRVLLCLLISSTMLLLPISTVIATSPARASFQSIHP